MKNLLVLSLLILNVGCSLSKQDEAAVRPDDLEFAVDTLDEQPAMSMDTLAVQPEKIAEMSIPDEYQAPPVEEAPMVAPEEPKFSEFTAPAESPMKHEPMEPAPYVEPMIVAKEATRHTATTNEVELSADYEHYEVQRGDTLMMVAFKIYGDYRKWKEIKAWNKETLKTKMGPGTKLKYYVPSQKFGWEPSGMPYLVKTGDTLQIISMDKYGTTRKWKSIYENNRPLIRNPNLIFAGFTLYYQPKRDLASQPR